MNRTQTDIMLERRNQELLRKIELMQLIGTTSGFFQAYFNNLSLPEVKTNTEAFEKVNNQYFELWGEYKYSDIKSFRYALKYHLKKGNLK